jgi:HEAT repeat protein
MRLNSIRLSVVSRQWRVGSIVIAFGVVPYLAPYAVQYVGPGFSRAFIWTVAAQQYSFEQVASGLKHQDAGTRLRAIQILKDADYQEAAAPIGEVLGDGDDRVQLAAIDAELSLFTVRPISRRERVGFIIERRTSTAGGDVATEGQLALKARQVPPQVLSGLVLALSDPNPRVRGEAIGLAALLAPVACPRRQLDTQLCAQIGNVLIENINSREAAVRRAAMQALGRLHYPNAVQALLDQLSYYQKGPDAYAAIEGLAGIGHPAAMSAFEELLTSSNADIRRLAVEGLARAGERESLGALQQMGQSERSGGVLLALHYANLKLGVEGSDVSQLIAALRDTSLRSIALRYLLDLAPSMAPVLTKSLQDPDPDVRRLVADVVGFSGDSTVLLDLAAVAKDPDPDVVLAAERALTRIKL